MGIFEFQAKFIFLHNLCIPFVVYYKKNYKSVKKDNVHKKNLILMNWSPQRQEKCKYWVNNYLIKYMTKKYRDITIYQGNVT